MNVTASAKRYKIVGCDWADSDIGRFRCKIRKTFKYGKAPFITTFAQVVWCGKRAKELESRYGNKFALSELQKV